MQVGSQPSMTEMFTVQVAWMPEHSSLLSILQQAHEMIVSRTAGLPATSVASTFCNPEPASAALRDMLEQHARQGGLKGIIRCEGHAHIPLFHEVLLWPRGCEFAQ